MVTKDDACWIIGLSAGAGIGVYLDGGWGVDALVGRETRAHNDIDLFVQRGDYQRFVDLIADEGFSEVAASFTTEDHTAEVASTVCHSCICEIQIVRHHAGVGIVGMEHHELLHYLWSLLHLCLLLGL